MKPPSTPGHQFRGPGTPWSIPLFGAVVVIVRVVFTKAVVVVNGCEVGLNAHVLSAGNPEHENVTVPLNESTGESVIVRFGEDPGVIDTMPAPALLLITKSGEATRAGEVDAT